MRKACPYVPHIAPNFPVANRQHQRSEMRARSPRRREPCDDHLLPPGGLDLQPVLAARTRQVAAGGALGHDALEPEPLRPLEQPLAMLGPMLAVGEQWVLWQQSAQML